MPHPTVDVSTAVLNLARELRSSLDRAFSESGLTSQQAGLLIHIYGGDSSPKSLGERLGIDTAGMTRILDRLERKRLVQRSKDPDDRRAIRVALTEAGVALVPALPPVFEDVAKRLVGELDVTATRAVLDQLTDNLDQGKVPN